MRTGKRIHTYGRKRLSGPGALATDGDGWSKHGLGREPETLGAFDRGLSSGPCAPEKAAKRAVELVKRTL
jgi:hypothetical protein